MWICVHGLGIGDHLQGVSKPGNTQCRERSIQSGARATSRCWSVYSRWRPASAHRTRRPGTRSGHTACRPGHRNRPLSAARCLADLRAGRLVHRSADRAPGPSLVGANAPKPCKEDGENEIATFCVQGQWKGLPVEEVILPTMTFVSFRGARIGLPLEKARPIVRQRFGQDFPGGAAYEEGREPKLMADPEDAQRSWLLCSTPELGHDVDSEEASAIPA
jgi:hypothetical protein